MTKTRKITVLLSESARQDAFINFWKALNKVCHKEVPFPAALVAFEAEYGPGPNAR